MARLTKHVLGVPSGQVGDSVCFSTWRGKACIRSIASSVYNPNTPTQQSNRLKFALLGKLTRPLARVLMSGFKAAGKYGRNAMTPLNAFVKYNFDKDDTFTGEGPDAWEIDFQKLSIAQGGLEGFATSKATLTPVSGGNDVVFTWTSDDTAAEDDEVYCVLYNKDLNLGKYATAARSEGTCSVSISDYWLEDSAKTECYIFAFDGSKASSSEWLNEVFD